MFVADIKKKRIARMRAFSNWRWHVDEIFVKINGERHYLWRAVDHEGEVLEAVVTKRRDEKSALKFPALGSKRTKNADALSPPFTPPSTTSSTRNAFSQADPF